MKLKPVLCVAALALVAGCESHQQNPYASFGEYGFSYDLEQAPVPGLTVAENERIAKMPSASMVALLAIPAPPAPPQTTVAAPSSEGTSPPKTETTAPVVPAPADTATPAPVPATPPAVAQ